MNEPCLFYYSKMAVRRRTTPLPHPSANCLLQYYSLFLPNIFGPQNWISLQPVVLNPDWQILTRERLFVLLRLVSKQSGTWSPLKLTMTTPSLICVSGSRTLSQLIQPPNRRESIERHTSDKVT